MNESTIIGTVPAANELHKIPGFDPMKHLSRSVDAQGEPIIQLEPRYQRLWFRLAYPKGRMLLNPLRITDQLAIFEAKVYFHRDDPDPVSSFTSNKTAQETPNYIRAAQDEALKEALDNAGFGIQLCDVTQTPSDIGRSGSSAQASVIEVAAEKTVLPPVRQAPVEEPAAAPTLVEKRTAQQPVTKAPSAAEPQRAPAVKETALGFNTAVHEDGPAPVERKPTTTDYQEVHSTASQKADFPVDDQQSVLTVLNFPVKAEESAAPQELTGAEIAGSSPSADTAAFEQVEAPVQAVTGYTEDTPIEEILQLMSMEEAQAVMAPNGTCTGWTMAQVAERRPSSLRFFLTSFCKCSNIQKAAASLLLTDLEQKKAG